MSENLDALAIAEWLAAMEFRAYKAFSELPKVFSEDSALCTLLKELAEDELLHHEAMVGARRFFENNPQVKLGVDIDVEAMAKVEEPFCELEAMASSGSLTRKVLLEYICKIEFAELNSIFLFIIDNCAGFDEVFTRAAESVKVHRRRVADFVAMDPQSRSLASRVSVPRLLKDNILLVDDKEAILNLFKELLSDEGSIYTARNGEEALKLIAERAYYAVVSDVDMPVMNGLDFYAELVRRHPSMKGRFIFLTGTLDAGRQEFFEKNDIRHLYKPVSIKELRASLRRIGALSSNRADERLPDQLS